VPEFKRNQAAWPGRRDSMPCCSRPLPRVRCRPHAAVANVIRRKAALARHGCSRAPSRRRSVRVVRSRRCGWACCPARRP